MKFLRANAVRWLNSRTRPGQECWLLAGGLWLFILGGLLGGGCSLPRQEPGTFQRQFAFGRDTFAYSNELFWVYRVNPDTGKTYHHWRDPSPDYAQHCFVVSRSVRQFFQHARFDPTLPATDEPTYRRLVRAVVHRNPRFELGPDDKIVLPGFANLHEFSAVYEQLLKEECGSMWQSYFQRGNWRMIWPFSATHQRRTAAQLADSIRRNRPPIVHVAHFPKLQINHALVLFAVHETAEGLEFELYDPNIATHSSKLYYRHASGRFYFPPQSYFPGGTVDVYEIFHRWNY